MQSSRRLSLLVATGTLITLSALTAACGANSEEPRSSTPGTAINAAVNAAGTETAVDKTTFISDLLTAIDRYDTVHLSIRAGTMGSGEVDIRYSDEGSLIHVDADFAQRGPSQFVIADGAVYVEQGQGGKWLTIDQDDPSYGSLLKTFTRLGPHESVVGLGRGTNTVTRVGSRDVDGETLAAYRLEVDPTIATGAFKALAGSSGISETLVFTFLVDDTGLLRRTEVDVVGETTTVSLSGWGTPVTITVPSGDDLVTS